MGVLRGPHGVLWGIDFFNRAMMMMQYFNSIRQVLIEYLASGHVNSEIVSSLGGLFPFDKASVNSNKKFETNNNVSQ